MFNFYWAGNLLRPSQTSML